MTYATPLPSPAQLYTSPTWSNGHWCSTVLYGEHNGETLEERDCNELIRKLAEKVKI